MTTRLPLAAFLAASLALCACDETTPPPPATPSGNAGTTGSGSTGALSHMSDNPTSVLGKSAQSGKTAARQMEQSQSRELAAAKEITGEAAALEVAGLQFSAPTEWQKQNAAAPRAAEFKAGDSTIVFFFFPGGQGGNVTQNLDRWKRMVLDDAGQPAEQEVIRRTVNGMAVTLVASSGTYQDGMPGQSSTPRKNYGFRGAIIEGPQGNVFVRLVGPQASVEEVEGAYREMIEGARKK